MLNLPTKKVTMSTISKENYLKAIFNHKHNFGKSASATVLAKNLEVSNAAISDMAKKLTLQGLVTYEKFKGMELTNKGEKIALSVIRRHRLWELFLLKVLNLNLSEVHDQAEILEHNTSEFLIDKIDEFLGFPEFDPHGHPIPNKHGDIPESPNLIMLADTEENKIYKMARVHDSDSELIDYLNKVGLLLGAQFKVIHKLDFDKSVTIQLKNIQLPLSKKISENIFVFEI